MIIGGFARRYMGLHISRSLMKMSHFADVFAKYEKPSELRVHLPENYQSFFLKHMENIVAKGSLSSKSGLSDRMPRYRRH
jgi:hypothetical protein